MLRQEVVAGRDRFGNFCGDMRVPAWGPDWKGLQSKRPNCELKESLATENSLPWGCDSLLPVEILEYLNGLAGVVYGKLDAAREL